MRFDAQADLVRDSSRSNRLTSNSDVFSMGLGPGRPGEGIPDTPRSGER